MFLRVLSPRVDSGTTKDKLFCYRVPTEEIKPFERPEYIKLHRAFIHPRQGSPRQSSRKQPQPPICSSFKGKTFYGDVSKKTAVDICTKKSLFAEAERQQVRGQAVLMTLRSGTHCTGMVYVTRDQFTQDNFSISSVLDKSCSSVTY